MTRGGGNREIEERDEMAEFGESGVMLLGLLLLLRPMMQTGEFL